jgi:hypothetical protein
MRMILMLLEFRAKNYKSFREELVFSMAPKPIRDLSFSVLRKKIGSKKYKALCSSVLFGANASGKSNALSSVDTFKSIVLRGNIRNSNENKSNASACFLELIPNCFDSGRNPISFRIRFIERGFLFEYGFDADVGGYMDQGYPRRIAFEELIVNEALVFTRFEKIEFGSFKTVAGLLDDDFEENKEIS